MHRSKWNLTTSISATLLILGSVQTAVAQTNRIPPVQIDDWYSKRFWWIVIIGAILGGVATVLWIQRLVPIPQGNDNWRARKHFVFALILAAALLGVLLLLDASLNHRFGNRSYTFSEVLFDVLITGQTLKMILAGAVGFTLAVAILTRFFGKRTYRYMLIPK